MAAELPLYKRTKTRGNGLREETTLGPSAGKTLVRIFAMLIAATLLMAGVIKWGDVAPAFRAVPLIPLELHERLPSPRVEPGHPSGGGREPPSRSFRLMQASLPSDAAPDR